MSRIAVVTGANKGIGFAIAKQLAQSPGIQVILTARDTARGQEAVNQLKEQKADVKFHQLDLTDKNSIDQFAAHIKKTYGGLDILVNNAGIAFKGDAFDENVARTTAATNYFGTRDVLDKLLPLVREHGRVVNVSSMAGRLSILSNELKGKFTDPKLNVEGINNLVNQFIADVADNTYSQKGWPKSCYGVSKVAVTALTTVLARDETYSKNGILINACCPGWVRTDMAGPNAPRTPDEGAKTPVMLALLPPGDTRTGLYWKDEKVREW